jgi:hypothetical protein
MACQEQEVDPTARGPVTDQSGVPDPGLVEDESVARAEILREISEPAMIE